MNRDICVDHHPNFRGIDLPLDGPDMRQLDLSLERDSTRALRRQTRLRDRSWDHRPTLWGPGRGRRRATCKPSPGSTKFQKRTLLVRVAVVGVFAIAIGLCSSGCELGSLLLSGHGPENSGWCPSLKVWNECRRDSSNPIEHRLLTIQTAASESRQRGRPSVGTPRHPH